MKLLIVRHADPDYSIDSLTAVGRKEAEILSRRLCAIDVKEFYVSPMGRAKDTAKTTLRKLGREGIECPWLQEFNAKIPDPDHYVWDWLPEEWTKQDVFYDAEQWCTQPIMGSGDVREKYDWVVRNFDALLAKHGYERKGRLYQAVHPNRDTLVFFCHFGVGCVLLSHLMNVSPVLLWHTLCAAPSSVTTLNTEERRQGTAVFRMASYGDISHLYAAGEEPSFAGRFCETYDRFDERHD